MSNPMPKPLSTEALDAETAVRLHEMELAAHLAGHWRAGNLNQDAVIDEGETLGAMAHFLTKEKPESLPEVIGGCPMHKEDVQTYWTSVFYKANAMIMNAELNAASVPKQAAGAVSRIEVPSPSLVCLQVLQRRKEMGIDR